MYEKKYLIDSEPASARDIITAASQLDSDFASDWCKQTSVAAGILRCNGHTVEDRPQESKVETGNSVQQAIKAEPQADITPKCSCGENMVFDENKQQWYCPISV